MYIRVKYFQPIKEKTKCDEEIFELPCTSNISKPLNIIIEKYLLNRNDFEEGRALIALERSEPLNNRILAYKDWANTVLKSEDRIILFWPIAGG